VLEDNALAQRLGQGGYDFARRRFTWPAVLDQTLALYGMPAAAKSQL